MVSVCWFLWLVLVGDLQYVLVCRLGGLCCGGVVRLIGCVLWYAGRDVLLMVFDVGCGLMCIAFWWLILV